MKDRTIAPGGPRRECSIFSPSADSRSRMSRHTPGPTGDASTRTACAVRSPSATLLGLYFYVTRLDGELSAAALSCFSGALTAVMAYRLARLVFSEAVAVRTGWLICFFPSMIVWSIQTIKEPIVILCELMGIYA